MDQVGVVTDGVTVGVVDVSPIGPAAQVSLGDVPQRVATLDRVAAGVSGSRRDLALRVGVAPATAAHLGRLRALEDFGPRGYVGGSLGGLLGGHTRLAMGTG